MSYSERSLARRLLESDPKALAQVIRWLSAALTVPRFWSVRDEWPDLLQEALTRVVESLRKGRFEESRDLRLYVQGIARHVAMTAQKRQQQPPPDGGTTTSGSRSQSPETLAVNAELARRVLDLASEDCRRLIRLYYYELKTYEEIAAILAVPVGTVKSRLSRCLASAHETPSDAVPRRKVMRARDPRR